MNQRDDTDLSNSNSLFGTKNYQISNLLIAVCGIWLIALGFYFMFLRPSLLPEDLRFLAVTPLHIHTTLPHLEQWLKKVFTVMGGFMSGSGILLLYIAIFVMPLRLKRSSGAIALSGVCTVLLMSAMNFAIASDFRWALLVPVLVWISGFGMYIFKR